VAEGLEVPCCMWPAVSNGRERCDRCSDMPLALRFSGFPLPAPVKKGCLRLYASADRRAPQIWRHGCWHVRDADVKAGMGLEE
jgi:hypothetical protein